MIFFQGFFGAFQNLIETSPLLHLGLLIITGTCFAYIAKMLKQPLIIAYVLAGIVIGPVGMGIINNPQEIRSLAELGVAFMLFTVGLEMDLKKLKNVGTASIIGGLFQVILTFFVGFSVSFYLGFNINSAIYFGLLTAFSSTMIVTKLLIDKNEVNTLHGRMMLGILLLQDVIAVLILPLLAINKPSLDTFIIIIIKTIGLFSFAFFLNRVLLKRILDYAAKSYELLFITGVAVCFLFIGLASILEFPISIGAFIGGLALASFPYNLEIEGETRSLRDFFAVIFFASLGMGLTPGIIYNKFFEVIVILLLIIMIKPLLLGIIYWLMGYGGRNALNIGFGLGQASEFSFIIATQGLVLGHLLPDTYSLIISIVVISILLTPYFMNIRKEVYSIFSKIEIPVLKKIEPKRLHKMEKHPKENLQNHIIVFGAHRMGRKIVEYLKERGEKFVVIEQNPEIVRELSQEGIYCRYGDAENEEILRKIGLYKADLAVITIPYNDTACFITRRAKRFNPVIKVFARAHTVKEAENLYNAGADFVVVPEFDSSEKVIKRLEEFFKRKKFLNNVFF